VSSGPQGAEKAILTGKNSDVAQDIFPTVTKARSFYGADNEVSAELIEDQSAESLALKKAEL
jgi:hypothetical protein